MAEISYSFGLEFTSLMLIAFIVLKLCKVITWSWWLVLTLLWINIFVLLVFLGVWFWANI